MRARASAASVIASGLATAAVLAACGDSDPCDGAATCLRIDIDSATVNTIETLLLDVVYGDLHSTTATAADGLSKLPLSTAIVLDLPDLTTVRVDVVAAGIVGDIPVGTGYVSRMVSVGQHAAARISLAPVAPCIDGRLSCGGHGLAGDSDTLYRCNFRGVPTARGRCVAGCTAHLGGEDDTCASGAVCQDGGKYCGGDKIEGDPQLLYVCADGVGTMPKLCADGCVIRAGTDDICRTAAAASVSAP